jgi:magnesium-transporting ATPase (P-type)
VIKSLNNFFASKKAGLAMALLALVIALSSLLPFLPSSLHIVLNALSIGFAVGLLPAFGRAYNDDWKKHKPWEGGFLSKAFFMAYVFFLLILLGAIVFKAFFWNKF